MRISDWSSDVCSSDLVHGGSGDPSPFTAYGVLQGLMAALNHKYGDEEVGKRTYAVQGAGHVGMELFKLLHERGAKVFVTDKIGNTSGGERVGRTVSLSWVAVSSKKNNTKHTNN